LGYTVDIDKQDDRLKAVGKNVLEVSLVKKGARENCHIYKDGEWNGESNVSIPSSIPSSISSSIPTSSLKETESEMKVSEMKESEKPNIGETTPGPEKGLEPETKRPRFDDWRLLMDM